ncbi:hypothetical protein Pfo_023306 [Paulownia fortunei]|nr:hypothetical protein Pfo_023306 [Paulownia fortunei]
MNTSTSFMKVFLILAGAVSLAMGIKLTVPVAVNEVPVIWSIILPWLKPPYLYIVMNAIIITIAVSSRFQQNQSEPPVHSQHLISVKTPPPADFASFSAQPEVGTSVEEPQAAYESEDSVVELKAVMVNGSKVDIETEEETLADTEAEAEDVFLALSTLTCNTLPQEILSPEFQLEYLLPVRDKPLISSRFGHPKPIRTTSERVRSLRVAREETLESTWKKITEGASRATREAPQEVRQAGAARPSPDRVRDHVPKSRSFEEGRSDHNSPLGPASTRIRKEPSLSQDELNRRVEAFIKKFKDEMRLQSQESLNKFMVMEQIM